MKKTLLLLFAAVGTMFNLSAQTILYDNGPLINNPGQGYSGADVSSLETGIHNFGYNNRLISGFRMSDEFVIPQGETWNIDTLAFFAYQTLAAGTIDPTPTITGINLQIWNGPPNNLTSMVVYGDTTVNLLEYSEWTGIYRTTSTAFMNTQRPVMRNVATVTGLILTAGTYWIDWQTDGSLTSGPWIPPITLSGQPITGNALQWSPAAGAWQVVYGDTLDTYPQGMPFQVIGSIISGISDIYNNGNISVSPNPFSSMTTIEIDEKLINNHANLTINITNILGQTVYHINSVTSRRIRFGRNNLDNGIYFYELRNNNKVISVGKLVIN